ncbi:MAG TPA: nucleotidyl transferase AbiEii/AbiGii toxin family protein [Acidimicrobiia bacterium]|nr:nucleotidyl transferase AbiEii/AbiGii toxin family protein [Acidimicrobiia bacterium]
MLTPLQLQIRQIVASLPGAEDLALAGGGALIVHGIVDRETRDLDFFSSSPEKVDQLLPFVEQALRDASLVVERLRVAEGFAQLSVASASETTTIDLAWDPRLLPPTVTAEGPLLAEEEVAAGKVLALFGRAEARDFVDVLALESRYGLDHLCQLAAEKDPGFDRTVLAEMMNRIDRLPRNEFGIEDAEYDRLKRRVELLRDELLGFDREPPGRSTKPSPRREPPSLGL